MWMVKKRVNKPIGIKCDYSKFRISLTTTNFSEWNILWMVGVLLVAYLL
jgi:hypothetical protein